MLGHAAVFHTRRTVHGYSHAPSPVRRCTAPCPSAPVHRPIGVAGAHRAQSAQTHRLARPILPSERISDRGRASRSSLVASHSDPSDFMLAIARPGLPSCVRRLNAGEAGGQTLFAGRANSDRPATCLLKLPQHGGWACTSMFVLLLYDQPSGYGHFSVAFRQTCVGCLVCLWPGAGGGRDEVLANPRAALKITRWAGHEPLRTGLTPRSIGLGMTTALARGEEKVT